jgi:hypothetical protein
MDCKNMLNFERNSYENIGMFPSERVGMPWCLVTPIATIAPG